MSRLAKVIAGGQTGVDQAALRAALEAGLDVGGWCPPGRLCESGTIPAVFPLRETPQERSELAPDVPRSLRTEWNVRDSDATLILEPAAGADPGTEVARRCAARYGRPTLDCDPEDPEAASRIVRWLKTLQIGVLNVAGPSEGSSPGIHDASYGVLVEVFAQFL